MAKALVIWNEIPEQIKYFIHEDPRPDAIEGLKICNHKFLGLEYSPEVEKELEDLSTHLLEYFIQIQSEQVFEYKPDYICVTGIIL